MTRKAFQPEFSRVFKCGKDCLHFLAQHKSRLPYHCLKCGHDHYSKGKTALHRRCKACGYDESPTANTLFSGVRFSLLKAFYLIYKLRQTAGRQSPTLLALQLQLQPKTVRRFRDRLAAGSHFSTDAPAQIGVDNFLHGLL